MSEVSDRLLHAKKLLKNFQAKQPKNLNGGQLNGFSSSSPSPNLETPGPSEFSNRRESCNGSLEPDKSTSIPHSANSSRPSSVFNDVNLSAENKEIISLRKTLKEREQTLDDTVKKLQSLHTHYSELYKAYNLITQTIENNAPTEYAAQISQLQTALGVAIEEKTGLLSDLRNLKYQLESVEAENKNFKEKSANSIPFSAENLILQLKSENHKLSEKVANQASEMEKYRRASSNLEGKIVLIQQDRTEIQGRLKYLYDEKSQLEQIVEQLRNELNMKEIYIRQLTRYSQNDPANDQLAIQTLAEEKRQFIEEIESRKLEYSELKKQFQNSTEYYDSLLAESRSQIGNLGAQLNELKSGKTELEHANTYLAEQMRLLRQNLEELSIGRTNEDLDKNSTKIDLKEYESISKKILDLKNENFNSQNTIHELNHLIEQKEQAIESLQHALMDSEQKISDFIEKSNAQSFMNMNLSQLSEQLQNEKATVSRAVAQNLELKEQLAELQDKLIVVTNESASKEDERITALANIKLFKQQIEELKNLNGKSVGSDTKTCLNNSESQTEILFEKERKNVQRNLRDSESQTENWLNTGEEFPSQNTGKLNKTDEMEKLDEDGNNLNVGSLNNAKDSTGNSENTSIDVQEGQIIEYKIKEENSKLTKKESQNCTFSTNKGSEVISDLETRHMSFERAQQVVILVSRIAKPSESETIKQLENCLNSALRQNDEMRMENEKLQHSLMVLENENESIGEYVALYRFQRSNIQKKITEKELNLLKLQQYCQFYEKQLGVLQSAIISFIDEKHNSEFEPKTKNESKNLDQILDLSINRMNPNNPETSDKVKNDRDSLNSNQNNNEEELLKNENAPNVEGYFVNSQRNKDPLLKIQELIKWQQQEFSHKTILQEDSLSNEFKKLEHRHSPSHLNLESVGCTECRGQMFTL